MTKRIAVTGMSVITPLGDTLAGFLGSLHAGRSAISRWKGTDAEGVPVKVVGDLSGYPVAKKLEEIEAALPGEVFKRLRRLVRRVPWSTKLSLLAGVEAIVHGGGFAGGPDPARMAVIVGGHNINSGYYLANLRAYIRCPEHADPLIMLLYPDTDHAACLSEVLSSKAGAYTTGGACASGNLALRSGIDEIRHHGAGAALVVGPAFDFSDADLHAMASLGTVSTESFNGCPEKASRPFDRDREGFVPSHGCAAILLEDMEAAIARGAVPLAEMLGVSTSSDGSHSPLPSEHGQARLMEAALSSCGVAREEVDFVSAHAASTQAGDVVEARAICRVFDGSRHSPKVNAPKSLLGHSCFSAAVVETVAAILQMNASELHPTINLDNPDPAVGFDACRHGPVHQPVRYLLKNAFGFGGINTVSVIRNPRL